MAVPWCGLHAVARCMLASTAYWAGAWSGVIVVTYTQTYGTAHHYNPSLVYWQWCITNWTNYIMCSNEWTSKLKVATAFNLNRFVTDAANFGFHHHSTIRKPEISKNIQYINVNKPNLPYKVIVTQVIGM